MPNIQPVESIQSIPPIKNQNIFKILFIISIIIILGIIVSFYFILNNKINKLNNKQNTEITSVSEQKTVITDNDTMPTIVPSIEDVDPTQILNSLQNTLKTITKLSTTSNSNWLENNQYTVLNGKDFFLGTSDSFGKYGNFTNTDVSSITLNSLKNLRSDIDNFFKSNDFQKNEINTVEYSNNNTTIGGASIGYTRNKTKCLITLYIKSDPFANIFCGIIDEEKSSQLKEFSLILNPKRDSNTSVEVSKVVDKYATGDVSSRYGGGGYTWIASKINDTWEVIWRGQDTISCSIVNQYKIPKEIYKDCYQE